MAQDGADGLSNVGGREHGQRDLVEQRLKGVVIAAVDHRDIDRQVPETFGSVKAGEASADDDDAGAMRLGRSGGGRDCGLIQLPCFGRLLGHGWPFRLRFGFNASYLMMREQARRWQGLGVDRATARDWWMVVCTSVRAGARADAAGVL